MEEIIEITEELRRRVVAQASAFQAAEPLLREVSETLTRLASGPLTSLVELLSPRLVAAFPVSPDEFVGVPPLEAAKRYLRRRPDARPFNEIVEAVKRGGGTISDERRFRLSLSRATTLLIKIGESYGLRERYPKEE